MNYIHDANITWGMHLVNYVKCLIGVKDIFKQWVYNTKGDFLIPYNLNKDVILEFEWLPKHYCPCNHFTNKNVLYLVNTHFGTIVMKNAHSPSTTL